MDELISTSRLKALLGVGKAALTELSARGILQRGAKKDTYRLEASVRGYIAYLREQASARGSEADVEARALGAAPADLSEVKAEQFRGELEAAEVEKLWTSKLRAFRDRILAIPHRVQYLSARQTVVLTQELRAALDELTDDKAPKSGGEVCKSPAVRSWSVCRFHGARSGAPKGKANGAWKHGYYSGAAKAERLVVKLLLKDAASLRKLVSDGET